eukprot:185807_1
MADTTDSLLIPPPRGRARKSSSHVHVASRRTLLAPADMVIPLVCGICVHLFYITLLGPILFLYYDTDYADVKQCTDTHFEIYLISALVIHILTLTTNVLSTVIAYQTKVLNPSKWLNVLLSIRLLLNVFEIFAIIYGLFVIFIMHQNKHCFVDNQILYILIAINLFSNLSLILLTWLVLFCCCSKRQSARINSEYQTHHTSFLHKYCRLCFYDQKSPKMTQTLTEMGGLISILMRGNPHDDLELTPSDIVTGLHLLRMLQKHYGLFDEKCALNSKKNESDTRLKELEYYTMYANAAYGIGLYTLSKPCSICCALPCAIPHDLDGDDDVLQRSANKCCCDGVQIDNSNLKVFLQRTGINASDLLLCCQIGDVHKVNFYVNFDRNRNALVITLRGTMSIQDSITDIECHPMHFAQIDEECYVHRGMGECAKYVFDTITQSHAILNFLDINCNCDIVLCGHSLGAGVCVILSLMFKYGVQNDTNHLSVFVNARRKLKAFAVAPPSVIEREFALRIQDEVSQFLTCIVHGYDIIPRLSFYGVACTRAAINRLLMECVQTPWWVYEKSLHVTHSTILNAFKHDSKYLNNYVNVIQHAQEMEEEEEEKKGDLDDDVLMPGYDYFLNDIKMDLKQMEQTSLQNNELSAAVSPEIWSKRFCQIGVVYHVMNADNEDVTQPRRPLQHKHRNMECIRNIFQTMWQSVVCNLLKCRICLDTKDTTYDVYHADPDSFCDKLLISPYLLADHMPQVYLNVLQTYNSSQ